MSTTTATPSDVRYCADGCGQQVVGKAQFRPGHDARFVSLLVAHAAERNFDEESLDHGQDALPTAALRQKFVRAFNNAHDRALAKQERATARAARVTVKGSIYRYLDATGTVKVGRWTYPARVWVRPETSEFWAERNSQRDGQGEWLDISDQGDVLDDRVTLKGRDRIREDITGWAGAVAA